MRQLTGLDASFLYLETNNSPMHIAGLSIYDPATAPGGKVRFKQIVENIASRVHRVPAMTSRLFTVPMKLDHPYWVNDGTFDPEFHVRHIALPAPGDWRQLCILVSRIHARPLDRSRPLWESYIIEGLDNVEGYPKGCFAVFTKMHHAAIDGASGVEINAIMHDLSPEMAAPESTQVFNVDSKPSKAELLLRAQINTIKSPFRFLGVTKDAAPGILKAAKGMLSGRLKRVNDIPRTRFNSTVSPYRVIGAFRTSFAEVRAIKNRFKPATVNDVALTIVGGALRKYLEAKDELPEKSLAAMAPVNIRTEDSKGSAGNQVSQMTVRLRTDVEGARERLQAVHEGTRDAKELTNAIGAKTMTDYTQFIPSTITASAARLASSMNLANRINPVYNTVVTNVPGPPIPLYYTGAKMLSSFGTGPVLDSTGLFHVISTYCDEFSVTFTACRDMLPDPEFYAECLQSSLDELKEAALLADQVEPKPKAKRKSASIQKKAS